MKVAFVNQPIDTIFPPGQNSVGACTYGVAHILAKSCDVVVYGSRDSHKALGAEFSAQGVKYKFLPSTLTDRWLYHARKNYSRLAAGAPALSTSALVHPGFARQVAMDLQRERCDVIHIQHCSQFAPVIREYNRAATIVLHLHAEWFSQSGSRVFEKRWAMVRMEITRRRFHSLMKQPRVNSSLLNSENAEPIFELGAAPRTGVQGEPATNRPRIETPRRHSLHVRAWYAGRSRDDALCLLETLERELPLTSQDSHRAAWCPGNSCRLL